MKRIFLLLLPIWSAAALSAQNDDIAYWGKTYAFLQRQAALSFETIEEMLLASPPATQDSFVRDAALLQLDLLLHDTRLDNTPAFYEFMRSRAQATIDALEKPVSEGVVIHRLYNDGFIVQTPGEVIAFDIIKGGPPQGEPYIPDELMQRIADRCDILFVTHAHGDHADEVVAGMFAGAGKPVIVPPGLWEKAPGMRYLRSEGGMLEEEIALPGQSPLNVKIFPGHQGELANNIYVVTTSKGYRVAHTGDQSNEKDMEWIAEIKDRTGVDVLMTICWFMPLYDGVEGFAPSLVIPGHENEMNHTIDHREAWWLTRERMQQITRPKVLMAWGESYYYKK